MESGGTVVKRKIRAEGIRFGTELRRIRLNAGLTQGQLARAVNVSTSLVSCFERGTHWPRRDVVEALDRTTRASGQLVRLWVELSNRQAYPDWLGELVEAEPQATLIRDYAPLAVPGLLQTEEYARTVIEAANSLATPRQIDELVAGRMRRQRIWEAAEPPVMMTVIAESVLTSPIGGPVVMNSQLAHLISQVEKHRIRLQVVPADTRLHPGLAGMFILLSIRDRADVLYVESAVSGTMIHEPAQVQRMSMLFGDLQAVALSPERSLSRLNEIRRQFRGTPEAVA